MASVRGILNIQSLNELTYEKKKMEGNPNAHAEPWGQGITRSPIASRAEPAPRQPGDGEARRTF